MHDEPQNNGITKQKPGANDGLLGCYAKAQNGRRWGSCAVAFCRSIITFI